MSGEEQSRIPTLRERMAALQLDQANIGRTPTSPPPTYEQSATKKTKVPPPPLPPKRPAEPRSASTNNPPVLPNGRANKVVGNLPEKPQKELLPAPVLKKWEGRDEDPRPSLPPRRPTDKAAPSLPPRRPSDQLSLNRQESRESLASAKSSVSATSTPRTSISGTSVNGQQRSTSRVRAPEYDPASLPPLPARKTTTEEPKADKPRVSLRPTISTPNVNQKPSSEGPPALPSRPSLPPRTSTSSTITAAKEEEAPPVKPPRRSALDFALNKTTEIPPPVPSERPSESTSPPPIPISSRPNVTGHNQSKTNGDTTVSTNGTTSTTAYPGGCLLCRDFTGPDNHAARYPREALPYSDINWLARELTSPFPSHTDKARVIFTWLHHNVAYDVKAFFGNCVRGKTPKQTLESGLAVCEGYAGLFAALATAAGLEAVVVGGHGKGIGYTNLSPNAPLPPPNPTGHAWNAVRIDNGAWKLLDACWGAGHVRQEDQSYHKAFNASMFTQSNEEFGERHFPENARYWFRSDGRGLSWEEYLLCDLPQPRVTVFTGADSQHGLSDKSFEPKGKEIKLQDPTATSPMVHFEFRKICPHWNLAAHLPGNHKPYLFLLKLHGRDGNTEEWVPFNTDTDRGGERWWCDVERAKLGRRGQDVMLYAQTTYLDGRDGRGLTAEEYRRTRPRWTSWGWGGVAQWVVV